MTTIDEDVEGEMYSLDFVPFLDLSDAAFTSGDTTGDDFGTGLLTEDQHPLEYCPIHSDATQCACNGFLGDWQLPEVAPEPIEDTVEEPDYSRFENWIPRLIRPEKPCDYCRSKRLCCYVQRGEPFCISCATLFRECSLSMSNTLEATNYVDKDRGTFLDTLHVVDEDVAKDRGMLTGIKLLKSKDFDNSSFTPFRDDVSGSTRRNGIRFPRHAVKILRDWLDSHANNPYPTEEEKAELERTTELKPVQIANWLANARRRRKVTEKARPKLCSSPSLRSSTAAIDIPSTPEKPWDELNPFERWKHSPPENEPALMRDIATNIANAVANNALPEPPMPVSPSTMGRSSKRMKGSSVGSGWSNHRAPSTGSAETGQTSSLSASSAALSNESSHSTHGSFSSFSSSLAGKKDRRKRRRPMTVAAAGIKPSDDKKRIFQCTFCTDTFKSKYDWTRHEKSLHLSLEKWICAPLGPVITNQESGNKQCVYCDLHNPSNDHIESHNHIQCEGKGLDARTFYRKDHLRQHLRLMHACEMTGAMDSWKSMAVNINSRCGLCAQRFTKWQDRIDHLTAHFKAGARMSDWKGCRGLDPAVAAQVTNAMPPYLIGMESISPNPFSATNRGSWQLTKEFLQYADVKTGLPCNAHLDRANSAADSNAWEILTVHLGNYAKKMADDGVAVTDEMLQGRARQVLYGSDDPWEQTAADNPEWLDMFKKARGLSFIPSAIGGQGSEIPDDLETYCDLGLRVPFAVQLHAYNEFQAGKQNLDAANHHTWPYTSAKSILRDTYLTLRHEGILYDGNQQCNHTACEPNLIDIKTIDGSVSPGHTTRRWCSEKLSTEAAARLAIIRGDTCQGDSPDREVLANKARARASTLNALERIEATIAVNCEDERRNASPRLGLRESQANLFATTTDAWKDSGVMSLSAASPLPGVEEDLATLNDASTSQIQISGPADWKMPDGHVVSEEELMDINATSSSEDYFIPGMNEMDFDWTVPEGMGVSTSASLAEQEDVDFGAFVFDGGFNMDS